MLAIKCSKAADAVFLIIGGLPPEDYLFFMQNNNIQNVIFKDFMATELLFKYLKACDVFIFGSLHDVWGLVINEAASVGLPIICSTGALAGVDFADNNNGIILYEKGNIKELIDRINSLETFNQAKLLEMGRKNIKKASLYSIEAMADCYYDLLMGFHYEK